MVEVSEFTLCFQWLAEEQSHSLYVERFSTVTNEIADVQQYLVRLADKMGVDIVVVLKQKIGKNEAKYPVEKVRGSSIKNYEYE